LYKGGFYRRKNICKGEKMENRERAELDNFKSEFERINNLYLPFISDYKKQTQILYIYVTIFATFFFEYFTNFDGFKGRLPLSILFIGIALSISILLFLISNILDSLSHLFLLESRKATLEQHINNHFGNKILVWDSKILPFFHDTKHMHWRFFISPGWLTAVFSTFILKLIILAHCFLVFKAANKYSMECPSDTFSIHLTGYIFIVIMLVASTFILNQWYLLNTIGREYINRKVYKLSGVYYKNIRVKFNSFPIIIFALTFFSGFLIFFMAAFDENVLFPGGKAQCPLIYNWSVIFGDSLLLPLINYKLASLITQFNRLLRREKILSIIVLVLILFLSIIGNWYSHEFWLHDRITDFISTDKISYTLVGKWHLIFSIIQTSILLFFVYLWFLSAKYNILYKQLSRIWWFVFPFTCLSIFDSLMKYFFIYKIDFLSVLVSERFTFLTPISAIIVLIIIKAFHKKEHHYHSV